MASQSPTPSAPHLLFRDSFERHRHLIGPMLDGDEVALAGLTGSEDAFRAVLHSNFCHDDTHYAIYDRYRDWRDLAPHFEHPIQVVAREHPEWIGNVLVDPVVAGTEPGQAMHEELFFWIRLVFLQDDADLESMDEDDEDNDELADSGDAHWAPEAAATRDLPAALGEYCLSLFRGERTASAERRYEAMCLLYHFEPRPADTFTVLGRCILGERDRDTKALIIQLLDNDAAAAHLDPAMVPRLKTLRSRLRKTMDPQVGEALDRIIIRLGGTPPKYTPG